MVQTKQTPDGLAEEPLDEELTGVFGKNPLESKALDIKLHSTVYTRWKYWYEKGINKDEKVELLEKYNCPAGLEVPKLNPEIALKIPSHSKSRDVYMAQRQQMVGSALNALGSVITMLIKEKDSVREKRREITAKLHEVGQLMIEVMHSQTKSRKALILAGVDKDTKAILADAKTEDYLFGKNLAEKFKEAKSMEKVAISIKRPAAPKTQLPLQRQPLNYNGLQGKRPVPNRAGYQDFQSGQYKPRHSSRGRMRNQPFNQGAPYQGQHRPQNQNQLK